jgi:peptidoglycan/LPS O-acetylase OafA/YrhL
MGLLRTIFALSVVFSHLGIYTFVGARNAVQIFYIISGFLISYILVESKNYPNIKHFYFNRILRIYPIYYFVAFISLLIYPILDIKFFYIIEQTSIIVNIFLFFSNFFIIGQDWIMFSGIKNNILIFSADFYKSEILLFEGLFIQQAWTLGLEITFYLIAPFILFNRKIILTLLILSILLRIYLIKIGIGLKDPWTYRFFPTELAFFLIGALSHQILFPFYKKIFNRNIDLVSKLSTYFLIIVSLIWFKIPIAQYFNSFILFILITLILPLTFFFSTNNKWDKYIGDLSYPIYIGHFLIINIMISLIRSLNLSENTYAVFIREIFDYKFYDSNITIFVIISIVLSILFALILNIYLCNKIELIRNKYRTNFTKKIV